MADGALRALFRDKMTVLVYQREKEEGRTVERETVFAEGIPCYLSFQKESVQEAGLTFWGLTGTVFYPFGIHIPENSRILVQKQGEKYAFSLSGKPRQYWTHGELTVKGEEALANRDDPK